MRAAPAGRLTVPSCCSPSQRHSPPVRAPTTRPPRAPALAPAPTVSARPRSASAAARSLDAVETHDRALLDARAAHDRTVAARRPSPRRPPRAAAAGRRLRRNCRRDRGGGPRGRLPARSARRAWASCSVARLPLSRRCHSEHAVAPALSAAAPSRRCAAPARCARRGRSPCRSPPRRRQLEHDRAVVLFEPLDDTSSGSSTRPCGEVRRAAPAPSPLAIAARRRLAVADALVRSSLRTVSEAARRAPASCARAPRRSRSSRGWSARCSGRSSRSRARRAESAGRPRPPATSGPSWRPLA